MLMELLIKKELEQVNFGKWKGNHNRPVFAILVQG